MTITPTWFQFEALDGIFNTFVKYVVTITSVDLPTPIVQTFADSEFRTTGLDYDIPQGSKVHQEVVQFYQNILGEHQTKPQVSDFIAGVAGYPRNLRVAFEGNCPLLSDTVRVIVSGVTNDDEGVPLPNGEYKCVWNADDAEWQQIVNLPEWATSRAGFLVGVTCIDGALYRRVVVYPSLEPIGGGTDIYNAPVVLDSGGADFGITGTATVVP